MSIKVRNYCLTFFKEPTVLLPEGVRYAIYGRELAPTTGTEHWQSYVELAAPQRPSWIKSVYSDETIHIEVRKGTRQQAIDYCKKDQNFTEHGSLPRGITDLKKVTNIEEIIETEPELYCRYRNGIRDIVALNQKKSIPDWRNLEVILLTGPTGCGKTRLAMQEATYKIQGYNLKWWQGYNLDTCICIDEFNNDVDITEMLALLDGYKLTLAVKGGHTYAAWTKVFITTNLRPNEIYWDKKEEHRRAFFRRVTVQSFWDTGPGNTIPDLVPH